jgi:FixJ family two-component response regulator
VDVVVLDVKMPGLSGLEVLTRIRTEFSRIPVILLTGHPTVQTALEGMKRGAFEYLMKPPVVETLATRIRAAHRHGREKIRERQEERVRDLLRDYPD